MAVWKNTFDFSYSKPMARAQLKNDQPTHDVGLLGENDDFAIMKCGFVLLPSANEIRLFVIIKLGTPARTS